MAINLFEILDQIKKEHNDFTTADFELYKEIIEEYSPLSEDRLFYRLIRIHHAARNEEKFKIVEKVLNHIKQKDPKIYAETLKVAFKRIIEYTLLHNENLFSPFAVTLLNQFQNLEPNDAQEFLRQIALAMVRSKHSCGRFYAQDFDEFRRGYLNDILEEGIEASYNRCTKWDLKTIADDAIATLPSLLTFFVSVLRKTVDLKETTIEQTFINYCSQVGNSDPFAGIPWSNLSDNSQAELVNQFTTEWENQYQNELDLKSILNLFSLLPQGPLEITADYLTYPPRVFTLAYEAAKNELQRQISADSEEDYDPSRTLDSSHTEKQC